MSPTDVTTIRYEQGHPSGNNALMRAIQALEKRDVARLISQSDWAALAELCDIRDAIAAGRGVLFGFPEKDAGNIVAWMSEAGCFQIDVEKMILKRDRLAEK